MKRGQRREIHSTVVVEQELPARILKAAGKYGDYKEYFAVRKELQMRLKKLLKGRKSKYHTWQIYRNYHKPDICYLVLIGS